MIEQTRQSGYRALGMVVAVAAALSFGAKFAYDYIRPAELPASSTANSPSSGAAHLAKGTPIVWRSKDDMKEGIHLINLDAARTHPELLLPLSSCLPRGGEQLTILDIGFGSREIILDSGPAKGCRGWVEMEYVVP
jgi:hypothetical protein